jgi:hypothetical protein
MASDVVPLPLAGRNLQAMSCTRQTTPTWAFPSFAAAPMGDQLANGDTRETVLAVLRDNGYPHASIEIIEEPGPVLRTLVARVRFSSGAMQP